MPWTIRLLSVWCLVLTPLVAIVEFNSGNRDLLLATGIFLYIVTGILLLLRNKHARMTLIAALLLPAILAFLMGRNPDPDEGRVVITLVFTLLFIAIMFIDKKISDYFSSSKQPDSETP